MRAQYLIPVILALLMLSACNGVKKTTPVVPDGQGTDSATATDAAGVDSQVASMDDVLADMNEATDNTTSADLDQMQQDLQGLE